MQCGRCGAEPQPGKRFCTDCGAALDAGCPGCGAPIETGKRFCGDCGTALGPMPGDGSAPTVAATLPAAPVAERRLCSLLFLDLVSFTTYAEHRDPEDVRELLSAYFERARTVVDRYGGTIEKFIGDAVMAVWGSPVATEEDAERAVRAALDLVDLVEQLGISAGAPGLSARAGVLTGDVAVTIGATNEGMVAGDAVNTAARIQSAASPGTVFVDGTTRRLTASAIDFANEGEHSLKGRGAPEQLWRALRVVSAVGGSQRVDGLEAPLTGRSAELRAIREMFHASADRRQPRMMVITGVAGVGKSRLGWEFEKYIDGLATTILWHRGQCLSYGDGLVYWALAEVVRRRFGIAEEDPPDVAERLLTEGLATLVSNEADREYIGPRLGRLLGVTSQGAGSAVFTRDELFAGWRRFFEHLATAAPVVIVIEDANHAAAELLDFFDQLIDWVRDLPIFVLVFARPEIEQRRAGFGTGRNRATITLDPLDPISMDTIVQNLVPGAPAGARLRITNRAEGIPLYAIESIRALVDREVIRPIDGSYRLVGDLGSLDELAIPDSLHSLLAARLDALDPVARKVVADCAVLGSTFPREAVAAVSGLDVAAADTVLSDLLRREVLEIAADPLSPERGNYRFTQEMLRQVAYDTLSRRDRKARHLSVATHLRQAFPNDGDEVIDAIARHYTDALDAVPDDGDSDQIRSAALDALVRAGKRARHAASAARAASCYDQAGHLALAANDPLRAAELWLQAADPLVDTNDGPGVNRLATRAREIYLAHDDPSGAARALTWIARGANLAGRLHECRTLLHEALAELGPEPSLDRLEALRLLSMSTLVGGDADEAAEIADLALHLGNVLDVDDAMYARLLAGRGTIFDAVGDRRQSTLFLKESARIAEVSGFRNVLSDVLTNLSNALLVDEPEAAVETAIHALAVVRELGLAGSESVVLTNIALGNLALGNWDAAELVMSESADHSVGGNNGSVGGNNGFHLLTSALVRSLRGIDAQDQIESALSRVNHEDPQDAAALGTSRAFAAVAGGEPDLALGLALEVMALIEREPWLSFAGDDGRWAWPLAARLAHELGRTDVEADLLAQLEAQPGGTPARMQRAEGALIRARLADVRGDGDASDLYDAAIAALRAGSTPFHLGHGLLDHAAFSASRQHDADQVAEMIDEATQIARSLGCQPMADRARGLAGARPATSTSG